VSSGTTPLHQAVISGLEAVVRLLVENGTQVSVSDMDGNQPLHWALERKSLRLARLLVGLGADLSATGKSE